jgi:hypothetical protein
MELPCAASKAFKPLRSRRAAAQMDISGWYRIVARRAVKVVRASLFAVAKSDSPSPRLIGVNTSV